MQDSKPTWGEASPVAIRAQDLFQQHFLAVAQRTDRLFGGLLVFQWLVAIAVALWVSPYAWAGPASYTHIHIWAALMLGGMTISLPVALILWRPGDVATRHAVGVAQMLMGALLIHLSGGRIETHFHVFGSLAFLAFYRDWRVLISSSAVVAADHLIRGYFWPQSAYGQLAGTEWRWLEHASWVVFEDLFLVNSCVRGVHEMRAMAQRRAELEDTKDKIEEKVHVRTAELETLNKAFALTAAQVRQSEEKYRHTLNAAADAIISVDENGLVIEFNRAAEAILGYTREELIGQPLAEIVPHRHRDAHNKGMMTFLKTGARRTPSWQALELPGLTKAGNEIPLEISLSVLRAGGRTYLTGVLRDITQRKRAEDEMRRTHEENQRILSSIPSIMIRLDGAGRVTKWNRAAAETLGITADQAIGKKLSECPGGWDAAMLTRDIESCLATGKPLDIDDFAFTPPGGQLVSLNVTISPVTDRDGTPLGSLLLGTDISHKRQLEAQLAQASKLESIGQLAAGIAHEINTPIQYVGDNTSFLKGAFADIQEVLDKHGALLAHIKTGSLQDDVIADVQAAMARADLEYLTDEIPRAIVQSLDGIDRVAKIVRAMKEFSHPDSEAKAGADINKLIENTVTIARNEWKYVAEVAMDFDSSLPLVPCLAGEFNQVILNLIVNAAHAIAERNAAEPGVKGIIAISTRALDDRVEIRIRDTGTGIPEGVRARVFDPFFTTKPVGKGSGQGLAIAHTAIVKKHCGVLTFETEVGQGTTFIVQLPFDENKDLRLAKSKSDPGRSGSAVYASASAATPVAST
jgi:PAS domain S-box-containing protein